MWCEILVLLGCMFGGMTAVIFTGALDYADGPTDGFGMRIMFPLRSPAPADYAIGLLSTAAGILVLLGCHVTKRYFLAWAVACYLIAIIWGLFLASPDGRHEEFLSILIATLVMLGCSAWALQPLRKKAPMTDAPPTNPPPPPPR